MFFFVLLRAWGKEKKLGPYKEYKESNLGESEFFSLSYANDETKNGIEQENDKKRSPSPPFKSKY